LKQFNQEFLALRYLHTAVQLGKVIFSLIISSPSTFTHCFPIGRNYYHHQVWRETATFEFDKAGGILLIDSGLLSNFILGNEIESRLISPNEISYF
jgi:hypothetical protein